MRMRSMKYRMALPSPPVPPISPALSPCVYTPQNRKYVPSQSGGIDSKPFLANRRISSRHSQGFFSRLRRSIRCAFVSLTCSAIRLPLVCRAKGKTHVSDVSDAWVGRNRSELRVLGTIPVGARACDHTTSGGNTTEHGLTTLQHSSWSLRELPGICQEIVSRRLKCNRRRCCRDIYDVTRPRSDFEEGSIGNESEVGVFSGPLRAVSQKRTSE